VNIFCVFVRSFLGRVEQSRAVNSLPTVRKELMKNDDDGDDGDYTPERRAYWRLAKERADRTIDDAEKQYFASHPNERPKTYDHDLFDVDELDEFEGDDDDDEEEREEDEKSEDDEDDDDEDDND
jgi:hypothetical protein